MTHTTTTSKPTTAFMGLSFLVLGTGMLAYCIGLFGAITVQKNTRDIEASRQGGY